MSRDPEMHGLLYAFRMAKAAYKLAQQEGDKEAVDAEMKEMNKILEQMAAGPTKMSKTAAPKTSFWVGFEKRAANTLLGAMSGITSGLRKFKSQGVLRSASPVSGQTIGSRAVNLNPPTPMQANTSLMQKANLHVNEVKMPKPPKPVMQRGRGISSMAI